MIKCPHCGNEDKTLISLNAAVSQGLHCEICSKDFVYHDLPITPTKPNIKKENNDE